MNLHVTKADGSTEFFKIEKLRRSLRRAGASTEEVQRIVDTVTGEIYDGVYTQEIYRRAFSLLRETAATAAARYSLRRALFGLGPSGFPFEQYLARIFEAEGYKTKVGIVMTGKCAPHEIDIAAYNDHHSFVGEAKFHSRPGTKTDLQVAMYSYARLLDLSNQKICQEDFCGVKEFWLITNTKFTTTAEKYAECAGVNLLSWDYPRHNNLHDRIARAGVYPITVLPQLNSAQASTLLKNGIILCQELLASPEALQPLHLTPERKNSLLAAAKAVCNFDTKVV